MTRPRMPSRRKPLRPDRRPNPAGKDIERLLYRDALDFMTEIFRADIRWFDELCGKELPQGGGIKEKEILEP